MLKYKSVLFKVSGESLMGGKGFGHDMMALQKACKEIVKVHDLGAEVSIVVGGGNIGGEKSNDPPSDFGCSTEPEGL
jgi:uridylate kinase